MRTITSDQLAREWPTIADEVDRAPIRVHRDAGPDIIMVSEAEYLMFRRYAGERLQAVMNRIGINAEARGLTEEQLEILLADES